MSVRHLVAFLAALTVQAGCRPPVHRIDEAEDSSVAKPTKSFCLETTENMGCIVSQRLAAEGVRSPDGGYLLDSSPQSEGRNVRREWVFLFDMRSQAGLGGYLAVGISVRPGSDSISASATVSLPRLRKDPNSWSVEVQALGDGVLVIRPLWTRWPLLQHAWRSCPEAEVFEPFSGEFFVAQPLEPGLTPKSEFEITGEGKTFRLELSREAIRELGVLDQCMAFVEILNRRFGSAESPWLYDAAKLSPSHLQDASSSFGKGRGQIRVAIQPDRVEPIHNGLSNFDPRVRIPMALLDRSGKRVGASLHIAFEPESESREAR